MSEAGSATAVRWTEERIKVAGVALRVRRAGAGPPVLVLPRDSGVAPETDFCDRLSARFSVYAPSHPGYDGSERPEWMRSVRDVAVMYQWLVGDLGLTGVSLVGLGFGGWIAAEMATMAPRALARLVLVGAMGIKPARGEILDQALLSYVDYVRAGFQDASAFGRVFGTDPTTPQLEQWDLNREMTFRIAWKPYMYNPTLPHLLGGVQAPALVVWGRSDRVVPLECGERYARALSRARLAVVEGAGHFVEMDQPAALTRLAVEFIGEPSAAAS